MALVAERGRLVLDGVRKVGFYAGEGIPEDDPLPACLRACLEYLGEDYGSLVVRAHGREWVANAGHVLLMGASGIAFRLTWGEGWQGDNVAIHYIAPDAEEPERRALAAVGYSYRMVLKEGRPEDEARLLAEVKASLARGVPVIAYGIIGPPEPCVVSGYDDGGRVLVGWNFFQGVAPFNEGLDFESDRRFRKAGWFEACEGLLVIGEKTVVPPARETYRRALEFALQVTRTSRVYRDRANGLAAYGAWAEALAGDADFAGQPEAVLRERHGVHDNVVGMVAEGRWYAGLFLHQVAAAIPGATSHLLAAADCYQREHDLMWEVWRLAGGNGNPEAWREFAKPAVRAAIVPVVLQARDEDSTAAEHLEAALRAWPGA